MCINAIVTPSTVRTAGHHLKRVAVACDLFADCSPRVFISAYYINLTREIQRRPVVCGRVDYLWFRRCNSRAYASLARAISGTIEQRPPNKSNLTEQRVPGHDETRAHHRFAIFFLLFSFFSLIAATCRDTLRTIALRAASSIVIRSKGEELVSTRWARTNLSYARRRCLSIVILLFE